MTGKERVLKAISCEEVDRVPWVPFCGVHAGSLIGEKADAYLTNADHIVNGLNKAIDLYRPDGIPVVFDLQIEAEILGCQLHWNQDNPPAVISHPLADGSKTLEDLKLPTAEDGRIPIVVDALRRLRTQHPDLALYGLITGPFTLALHMLGPEIFMMMFDDPAGIQKILAHCAEIGKSMSSIYVENGCDIVAVVDPMTSQIGPDQFEEFCTAPSQAVFDHIHELGAKGSLFVCGHAKNNIEVMCNTHCDNVSVDENIPLDYVKEICQANNVSFGGNLQLTAVMLLGTPDSNMVNAVECLDIGGKTGFILSPGCDMPYATPPANASAIADVVLDPYQQTVARELATQQSNNIEPLDLTGYVDSKRVKVDIITLDSAGCAPCQYMVEAVAQAAAPFGDKVVWKEHKIKEPEAIRMMFALGVKNIPTVCIDGEIIFVSTIPTISRIAQVIQEHVDAKGL